jgi:hypothetical protein
VLILAATVCHVCGKPVTYYVDDRIQALHPAPVVERMVAKIIADHSPACAEEYARREPVA